MVAKIKADATEQVKKIKADAEKEVEATVVTRPAASSTVPGRLKAMAAPMLSFASADTDTKKLPEALRNAGLIVDSYGDLTCPNRCNPVPLSLLGQHLPDWITGIYLPGKAAGALSSLKNCTFLRRIHGCEESLEQNHQVNLKSHVLGVGSRGGTFQGAGSLKPLFL